MIVNKGLGNDTIICAINLSNPYYHVYGFVPRHRISTHPTLKKPLKFAFPNYPQGCACTPNMVIVFYLGVKTNSDPKKGDFPYYTSCMRCHNEIVS